MKRPAPSPPNAPDLPPPPQKEGPGCFAVVLTLSLGIVATLLGFFCFLFTPDLKVCLKYWTADKRAVVEAGLVNYGTIRISDWSTTGFRTTARYDYDLDGKRNTVRVQFFEDTTMSEPDFRPPKTLTVRHYRDAEGKWVYVPREYFDEVRCSLLWTAALIGCGVLLLGSAVRNIGISVIRNRGNA